MDTASGMAALLENYARLLAKLAKGRAGSIHVLQVAPLRFTTALRDESMEKGALGNLPIQYLRDLVNSKFLKLGLLLEDQASVGGDSEAFNGALEDLFAIDESLIEGEVQRYNRVQNKRKREDAAALKSQQNVTFVGQWDTLDYKDLYILNELLKVLIEELKVEQKIYQSPFGTPPSNSTFLHSVEEHNSEEHLSYVVFRVLVI